MDELRFEDQVWGELKTRLNSGEPNKVPFEKYLKVPPEDAGLRGKSRIALVIGAGDIIRGDDNDNGQDETNLTSYGFTKLLKQVANDSSIKAVIVRIDSPGGEVTASDELLRQTTLLGQKKPLVFSMSDLAASGGYYMAMTGDPIAAYPQTETGSIGVVFGKPNLHGLYDKLGITKDAVERGKHAGIDSDYTPLTPEERQVLKQGIDESYHDFVSKVAAARRRPFAEMEPVAQGRVWLGSQAKARNLVDELGGLDIAVEMVKRRPISPPASRSAFWCTPADAASSTGFSAARKRTCCETRLAQVFGKVPYRAWMGGGMLRILPYWISIL